MKFTYKGREFRFVRNEKLHVSEGYWISNQQIGDHPPGMIVSMKLSAVLTSEARAAGLKEKHDFALTYHHPKVVKSGSGTGNGKPGRPKKPTTIIKIALAL